MNGGPQLLIGQVVHRRLRPVVNAFAYPVFYLQLPLEDLAAAEGPVFSVDSFNLLSFFTRDHGPRDGTPLLPWVQGHLRQRGLTDQVSVTLQCFPRVFGYVFNPVSFWFCRDREGELIAVLAEVNNTFGGRHSYLLHHPDGAPIRDGQVFEASKAFHVSPFCEVEGGYRFRFELERRRPLIRLDYDDAQGALLQTSLSGERRGWTTGAQLGALLRMPLLTVGVMFRIHWQALRLWLKGVRFVGSKSPSHLQEPAA